MNTVDFFWRVIPWQSVVVFLLGVFFVFSTIGSAVDIIQMGRQPTLRFALNVLLFGVFAVLYAVVALVLRGKFLKALFPLIVGEMVLLGPLLPDRPEPTPMGVADVARLQSRLALSGSVTMRAWLGARFVSFASLLLRANVILVSMRRWRLPGWLRRTEVQRRHSKILTSRHWHA